MTYIKKSILVCSVFWLLLGHHTPFLSASEAASKDTIKLSFSTMFPASHMHGVVAQKFADVIKERTHGRVEITVYPGGSLTSAANCYHGVVKGLSDIGGSCPLYVQGRFPASELFELPHYVPNAWVNTQVFNDFCGHFKLKEYEDVHMLYGHGPGHAVLQSAKRKVSEPADLKGMSVRASGTSAKVITAWGGTPRTMPMGEVYEALAKNVVEANFAYVETLKGFQHAEVTKYVSKFPVSCSSCQFVTMNRNKWNSLPKDIQQIFTQTSEEFVDLHGQAWNYIDEEGLKYFLSLGGGREYVEIPKEKRPQWEELVSPIMNQYIEEKTAMGLPAKEYLKYIIERTEYYVQRQPTAEKCADTVKAWFPKYLK